MSNSLKAIRAKTGLSQVQAAKILGVSRHKYQNMESGKSEVPPDAEAKLMAAVKVSIRNEVEIKRVSLVDRNDPSLEYFGEVVVHFVSNNEPFIASVSTAEASRVANALFDDDQFFVFRTLANQLVIINRSLVTDLYVSNEASDTYGPEHKRYHYPHQIMEPDMKVWVAANEIAYNGMLSEADIYDSFDDSDLAVHLRYVAKNYIVPKDIKDILKSNGLRGDDVVEEVKRLEERSERFFELADRLEYRFSNGLVRKVPVGLSDELKDVFSTIVDGDGYDGEFISFSCDDHSQIAFVSTKNFEYITIPNHIYEASEIEE